jgi:hypothetical protein
VGCLTRLLGSVLGVVVLLAVTTSSAQGQSPRAELLKKSSMVFVGTVERVGAVSFSGVPVSPRTVVVRVDAVLEKPASVSLAPGDRATVEVQDSALFRGGTQATFYADGWIFGEGVAVREVGHEPSPVAMRTVALGQNASEVSQTRQQLSDDELRARIQAADMVMVGRVLSVRQATLAVAGDRPTRITEHDPAWQEAVIRVVSGLKGVQADQEVVVRFPGSLDVAWHGVPKFKVGQEGTFLLQKDRVTGTPKAMLAGAPVDAYTALDAKDALPKDQADRVRRLTRP